MQVNFHSLLVAVYNDEIPGSSPGSHTASEASDLLTVGFEL